jgi:hypothetical protein
MDLPIVHYQYVTCLRLRGKNTVLLFTSIFTEIPGDILIQDEDTSPPKISSIIAKLDHFQE